jgi:hypothetical protein
MENPICYCGSQSSLQSNSLIYNGKEYGNGKVWLCDRFPACRGSVGTHPDGRPLGTIPDAETKKLRMEVHALIDPVWKSGKLKRGQVYARLSKAIGKTYHTGETTVDDCRKILKDAPLLLTL